MSARKNVNLIAIVFVVTSSITFKCLPLGKERTSLNFTETASSHHYKSEEHTVTTEDGYLLTVFRITKSRKCHEKTKLKPVLLMHGLLQNSDVFIDAGPSAGLAYLLSDDCYDVWVGNQRGNNYARKHLRLNPDKDAQFWKFSADEIGFYDVPATIDYILEHTASDKLDYIGFSQGGGTFFIMCSERAGYCDKAAVMIALAPAVLLANGESVMLKIIFSFMINFRRVFETFGYYEVFTKGSFFQALLENVCDITDPWIDELCATGAFLDGYHPGSKTGSSQRLFLHHLMMGTSLDTMVRYAQLVTNGKFQKLDFGEEMNLKRYNSTQAPQYNLKAVSAPVVLIQGRNDRMVSILDVKKLRKKLPNMVEMFEVPDPLWTHLDMLYSRDIKDMIYPKISQYLRKYSKSYN